MTTSLSGPGGLTKATTGTVTLSGANKYKGATTVSSGTLIVASGPFADRDEPDHRRHIGHPAKVIIAATDASGHPLSDSAAAQVNGITASAAARIADGSEQASPASAEPSLAPDLFPNPPNVDWKAKRPIVASSTSIPIRGDSQRSGEPAALNVVFGADNLQVESLRGWKWLGADLPGVGDSSTPGGLTSDLLELLATDRLRFAQMPLAPADSPIERIIGAPLRE